MSSQLLPLGDHSCVVSLTSVILTGSRPVIFTRLTDENDNHVTHTVRLAPDPTKTAADPTKFRQALEIGLNELRGGFPEQLALLDDKAVVIAIKNGEIDGLPVNVSIVQQERDGKPFRLPNGDVAFNVRLRPYEPMSDEVASSLLDNILTPAPALVPAGAFEE
jgi:hypothetical protein